MAANTYTITNCHCFEFIATLYWALNINSKPIFSCAMSVYEFIKDNICMDKCISIDVIKCCIVNATNSYSRH